MNPIQAELLVTVVRHAHSIPQRNILFHITFIIHYCMSIVTVDCHYRDVVEVRLIGHILTVRYHAILTVRYHAILTVRYHCNMFITSAVSI